MSFFRLIGTYAIPYIFCESVFRHIYEYHFGIVTNSDALFPYLFAKDIWSVGVKGWNLPPSSYLFPDLFLSGGIYPFTKTTFDFFQCFGFFLYFLPGYLSVRLGLHHSLGPLVSLAFFLLTSLFPATLGQFFLPGFHGSVFFILILYLVLLGPKTPINLNLGLKLVLLTSLTFLSEHLFWIQTGVLVVPLLIQKFSNQKRQLIAITILSFLLYFALLKLCEMLGLGITSISQFSPKQIFLNFISVDGFIKAFDWFLLETSNPELQIWLGIYLVSTGLVFIFLWFRKKEKESLSIQLLSLSPLISILLLSIFSLSFNFRYLYFIVWIPVYLFFFALQYLQFKKLTLYIFTIVFTLFFFYYRSEPMRNQTQKGSRDRESRLACLDSLNQSSSLATSYWPTKYLRSFSKTEIHPVPFQGRGEYYHWIHNRSWDEGVHMKRIHEFPVLLLDQAGELEFQNLLLNSNFKESARCGNWKIFKQGISL